MTVYCFIVYKVVSLGANMARSYEWDDQILKCQSLSEVEHTIQQHETTTTTKFVPFTQDKKYASKLCIL